MGFFKKISPSERKGLIIAWIALAISFTIALYAFGGLVSLIGSVVNGNGFTLDGPRFLLTFIAALIIVGVSFVCHELAHKFIAMHYGFWSEFCKSNPMLVISVCLACLLGIVFAAPGATLISSGGKPITKQQNGVISLMGPLMNIVMLFVFGVIMLIGLATGSVHFITGAGFAYALTPSGFLFYIGYTGWLVNAMFAFFNMLPVGPLDGKNVLQWNGLIFLVVITISVFLLYIPFDPNMMGSIVKFFVPGAVMTL